jgi:hypothetical protein
LPVHPVPTELINNFTIFDTGVMTLWQVHIQKYIFQVEVGII